MPNRRLSHYRQPTHTLGLLTVLAAFGALGRPGLAVAAAPLAALRTPVQAAAQAAVQAPDTIPGSALLQPEQLKDLLAAGQRPTVLQVGSHTLFTEAHIPGSEYAGAAATPEGLATLRTRVAKLPRNAPIVLYCGCCPWGRCPNIRPAYRELHELGLTNVKVLYLAQDFGTDWANKGFPVERGK